MSMVDDLEARGYVRRVPDPADARAKLVRLTARGRRAAAECRRAIQGSSSGPAASWATGATTPCGRRSRCCRSRSSPIE